ncbi:hypothetical protein EJ03DRAFT_352089 [Teratosphaeria nubilosa]|uniref:Uncharacterized protein n=1 Tax=Teratosphaeria nubilosa TaxID=161662 RepID=A0A6G1L7H9_9PEZI|nr:hypothetical protein EJ03DRAFT_352089 [Teratosphaeria nubilosa]
MHLPTLLAALASSAQALAQSKQCAAHERNRYEPSGKLTAAFTNATCTAAGGSLSKAGNQACCTFDAGRRKDFDDNCMRPAQDSWSGLPQARWAGIGGW